MNLRFVSDNSGDWEGIYFDDELMFQDHCISATDALRMVSTLSGFEYFEVECVIEGKLPYNFKDVVFKEEIENE